MVITQGRHPVPETVRRIEGALAERGLTLFARIDHAAGARAVGLDLPDEVVLLFGDPRVGTLLMQEAPAVGIALPLRMLVWREGGVTRIGFEDPSELAPRFSIGDHAETLQQMHLLLDGLAAAAEGDDTETALG